MSFAYFETSAIIVAVYWNIHMYYNTHFTTLITTACVVQWNECQLPHLGVAISPVRITTSEFILFFFFLDFQNMYIFLFIFSLSFLYVFFLSDKVHSCISEFDLLLRTYTKWLYKEQFWCYLVCSSFPYEQREVW